MQNLGSEFRQWIAFQLGTQDYHFDPLQGDASFRAYSRIKLKDKSYIAMLAPPTQERTDAFVGIANTWKEYGLQVPEVLGWEPQQGFVLLSDFGDTLLLDLLTPDSMENFYQQAMQTIALIQTTSTSTYPLPPFDQSYVYVELGLFREWFLKKWLGFHLENENDMLNEVFKNLSQDFISQPQVAIHRDYHSRNLMVLKDGTLGVIDFQDAMIGPITYDLVSLLKDCYISWPSAQTKRLVNIFFDKHVKHKVDRAIDFQKFLQWFDWVGLQRHIKVLGIFSRLKLRDNKPHYLQHMPRIMHYVLEVTQQYPLFAAFNHYLESKVLPAMLEAMQAQNIPVESQYKVA